MQSAINKIHAILDQLNEQALQVDQQNKHSKSHKIIQENDIFSEALFLTHSDLF
ncbi:MAG: primosomal replication protein N'', partial [Colwellia sp.]